MILAIDPSGTHTGIAVLDGKEIIRLDQLNPKGADYEEKTIHVITWIKSILKEIKPSMALLELPSFFSHTRPGMNSYHGLDSRIKKLYNLVTELQVELFNCGVPVICVPPHISKCKTNKMPEKKEDTALRVLRIHPESYKLREKISDHITDAIALLVWWENRNAEEHIEKIETL